MQIVFILFIANAFGQYSLYICSLSLSLSNNSSTINMSFKTWSLPGNPNFREPLLISSDFSRSSSCVKTLNGESKIPVFQKTLFGQLRNKDTKEGVCWKATSLHDSFKSGRSQMLSKAYGSSDPPCVCRTATNRYCTCMVQYSYAITYDGEFVEISQITFFFN